MIKILSQKDYLLTEVSVSPEATPEEIDLLMRTMKANAKVTIVYNGGKYPGINIEQRTHVSAGAAPRVREMLGIVDREL